MGMQLGPSRRLSMFENRMLRRIFGPKRYEVTGGWRKLHSCNEELHNLYSHQMKDNEVNGACGMHGGHEKFVQNSGWES
jgi:hypothetical protein